MTIEQSKRYTEISKKLFAYVDADEYEDALNYGKESEAELKKMLKKETFDNLEYKVKTIIRMLKALS